MEGRMKQSSEGHIWHLGLSLATPDLMATTYKIGKIKVFDRISNLAPIYIPKRPMETDMRFLKNCCCQVQSVMEKP